MPNSTPLGLNSTVVASKGQISRDLDGEIVILNLDRGVYHGLNPTGARVWQLIQEPRAVADIRDTMLREFAVDAAQCEKDLLAILQELASNGLLEIEPAAGG